MICTCYVDCDLYLKILVVSEVHTLVQAFFLKYILFYVLALKRGFFT